MKAVLGRGFLVAEETDCNALDVGSVTAAVIDVQGLLEDEPGKLAPRLDHDFRIQ